MSHLILIRTHLPEATPGRLYHNVDVEPFLYTLEPPWRDNLRNESCIPAGIYEMVWNETGLWRNTWQLRDLLSPIKEVGPDYCYPRYAIEFHNGTDVQHTDGCILTLLDSRADLRGAGAASAPRDAMETLRHVLGAGTNHLLHIVWEREGVED